VAAGAQALSTRVRLATIRKIFIDNFFILASLERKIRN
jgi:hypothetical protein